MIHPYLDAINIDLKSFREKFYVEVCGGHLQPVLDTIQRCKKYGIWQEITMLVIPGYNDRAEGLRDIAEFIVSVDPTIPWHISRFFPQ
jgi:pyruvate formate lyase activating enzyme